MQAVGGGGKTALAGDFDKGAQVFEFHWRDSILEWLQV